MKRFTLLAAAVAAVLTAPLASTAATAAPSPTGLTHRNVRVCSIAVGAAACLAIRHDTLRNGKPVPNVAPSGYGPAALQSVYGATAPAGTPTIAIVDAYDDPYAERDLATYRAQFNLPACTTSNGCFRKVNQNGGTTYPRGNTGWAEEISLDLDMASAICPGCKLLLVEASSNSFSNLGTAVKYAAGHAVAVSNSYGGSDASDNSYGGYYKDPKVAITASTGDNGYGVEYPASSQYVVAVGGTSLTKSTSGSFSETAWSGAGSGCSAYNTQPLWQQSVGTGCGKRAVADVSAVADPNTGVAVYDSYRESGWLVFGGTSVSSPIIAAFYAIGGTHGADYPASYTYANATPTSLHDVTSGSNGSCSTTQWCHARSGWDGPTGLGTPNGAAAF